MTEDRLMSVTPPLREIFIQGLALSWKLLRETGPIMAILAVLPVLSSIVFWSPSLVVSHVSVPQVGAALFALTVGSLALAGEEERQTDRFLRALPVRTQGLLMGIVLVAMAGSGLCALIGYLMLAAACIVLRDSSLFQPWPGELYWGVISWCGVTAELFVWGLFFSLVMRKVIWCALTAAAVVYSWNVSLVEAWFCVFGDTFQSPPTSLTVAFTWERAGELIIPRVIFVVLVFVIDSHLLTRWLRLALDHSGWFRLPKFQWAAQIAERCRPFSRLALIRLLAFRRPPVQLADRPRHLIWLQHRQAQGIEIFLKISAVIQTVVLAWFVVSIYFQPPDLEPMNKRLWVEDSRIILIVFYPLFVTEILGIAVWSFDRQPASREFLARLPVNAGALWWSKQCWAMP